MLLKQNILPWKNEVNNLKNQSVIAKFKIYIKKQVNQNTNTKEQISFRIKYRFLTQFPGFGKQNKIGNNFRRGLNSRTSLEEPVFHGHRLPQLRQWLNRTPSVVILLDTFTSNVTSPATSEDQYSQVQIPWNWSQAFEEGSHS